MRKTASVAISISVALILALFATGMRTSVAAAKAGELNLLAAERDSSMSLSPPLQNASYIWVLPSEEKDYPEYKRVEGGKHGDGTMMYVCRVGGTTPGKLYKKQCLAPYGGLEYSADYYQVLLTNAQYQWKAVHNLSRAQIKSGAVKGGVDRGNITLYVCRKKMTDGLHPGKYASNSGLCYISWGGGEKYYSDGFDVLFK